MIAGCAQLGTRRHFYVRPVTLPLARFLDSTLFKHQPSPCSPQPTCRLYFYFFRLQLLTVHPPHITLLDTRRDPAMPLSPLSRDGRHALRGPELDLGDAPVEGNYGSKRDGSCDTSHPDAPLHEKAKEKKKRSRVTPAQLAQLEQFFATDRSPTASRRKEISQELGMPERQTQIWFQNRCRYAARCRALY
jgi:hypothetical protein